MSNRKCTYTHWQNYNNNNTRRIEHRTNGHHMYRHTLVQPRECVQGPYWLLTAPYSPRSSLQCLRYQPLTYPPPCVYCVCVSVWDRISVSSLQKKNGSHSNMCNTCMSQRLYDNSVQLHIQTHEHACRYSGTWQHVQHTQLRTGTCVLCIYIPIFI